MKINYWILYHIIKYILFPIVGFIIGLLALIISNWIFILFIIWPFFCIILMQKIKCPKCKRSIDGTHSIFEINENSWRFLISKKCLNCGYVFIGKKENGAAKKKGKKDNRKHVR